MRFFFREFDFDTYQLKNHNRIHLGLLPGIKNPYALKKMTKQDATREVMKIRSFFGTLTEVESQIWGVKRGVGTSDNDSQRSKRRKLSDMGVITDEPQSVEEADRVPRDENQITDNSLLGAMMQNDATMSVAHSGTQDAEIVDPPPVSLQETSGPLSGDIEKERDADASLTTLVRDVQSDPEERVLDLETELAIRGGFERDKPDKRMTRRERIVQLKRMRKERKTLVLLSGGKNDISVRDPLPVTPIAVVNTLTGTEELFMKTTKTPENYLAERKTRLDDISNAVNETEPEQLRTSFARQRPEL
ncbi:hypothetical protein METSCH_F04250 [Metschnikowia aff. pulcherrima]|uniref:Uncharacterized protein n=1 Tax=Metschnikowia aff. pulcherrima TaxID=2163413 RepID=A0A4P6XTB1_9ASCO|nr:hypothetical protein METSCH_F04250 [Metschnikowia aff. pulcherrima]